MLPGNGPDLQRNTPLIIKIILFSIAYFLSAHLGLFLSIKPNLFAPFWPPGGIYLSVLLLTRMRHWPWFILAAVCGNIGFDLTTGKALQVSLLFSLGNSLEAMCGAWAVRKVVGGIPSMEKVRDIVALVIIGTVLCPLLSAATGTLTLRYLLSAPEWPVRIFMRWWSSDALSIILFTPFLLTLAGNKQALSFRTLFPTLPARMALEKIGWSILFLSSLWLIFLATPNELISYNYLLWPLLIWAGLRFRMTSLLLINLFISLFGAFMVSHGPTFFTIHHGTPLFPTISLHFFLFVLTSSGLVIAAISNERRKHQAALKTSEEQFRNMFESTLDGILVADPATQRFSRANHAMLSMTGYTLEEITSLSVDEIHPKESLDFIHKKFQSALDGSDPIATNAPVKRKNGSLFYADINAAPFIFEGKKYVLGVFRDVSDRRISEEALRESERLLKQAQQVAMLGHYVLDAKTGTWTCSEMLDTIFGITGEFDKNVEGWLSIVHPDDRTMIHEHLEYHVLRDKNNFDRQYRIIRQSDGALRWVHGRGSLEFDDHGTAIKMFGTIQDITENKRSEEALQRSEERFRSIVDNINDAFYIHDFDGTISDCNENACRMLGYSREEIVGSSLQKIDSTTEAHLMTARMKKLLASGTLQFNGKHRRKDGSLVDVSVSARIVSREGSGAVQSLVRDITDQKLAELNMMKAEKLESLGHLAGGIAHDFNNLLAGIFGNIDLALNEAESGKAQDAARFLSKALGVFNRAKDLTRQLLTFSKGGAPVRKPGAIAETIRETVSFALSGSAIKAFFDLSSDLWSCEYDPHQIEQVIDNITINAKQAMPEGGELHVGAVNIRVESDSVLHLKPGSYVKIWIRDKGIGIPAEYLHKIFDPFFSTKQTGSGLGLATCWSIIKKHNGHIDVESLPGKGTCFYIYLPASTWEAQPRSQKKQVVRRGSGKILVMDDESYIRDFTSSALSSLGYTAVTAIEGSEIVRIYQEALSSKKPFKAVILDLTIPGGMGGRETIVRLMEIDPQVRAIASSGYADDPIMADPVTAGFAASISKPYRKEELAEVLERVVNRG